MNAQLEARNITKRFGGLEALRGVSLTAQGEILGLIGPNGAGKTTFFNVICGFLRPTSGQVLFEDLPIHTRRTHEITQMGIARTFQIVNPFTGMTVLDNVLSGLGCHIYGSPRAFAGRFRSRRMTEQACGLLELTDLTPWTGTLAGNLPIGLQRKLEIARALATNPRLLLLDEPAAGLTSGEATELAGLVRKLHVQGKTVVVIEHNMAFAMNLCHRIVVLARGEIIAQGTPEQVRADARVINAYLGQ